MVCFDITFNNEGDRSFYNQPGILDVMANTLLEGAGERDAVALKKLLDNHSITIYIPPDSDDLRINVYCLTKYFDLVIDVLCDILAKAHFKAEKVEKTKQNYIASIKQTMYTPASLAREKLDDLMYPDGHPYKCSFKTLLTKLPTYTREDIVKCYNTVFNPDNAVITVVSNLTPTQIKNGFNKLFNSIKGRKNNFKSVEQKTDLRIAGVAEHVALDNPQSSLMFALPGVSRTSHDKFAVRIANEVLGKSGLVSRLSKSIRDTYGLVYRIRTDVITNKDMQAFIKGMSDTRAENVKDVISKIKKECEDIYKNGITETELKRAKIEKYADTILDTNETILDFVISIRTDGVQISGVNNYFDNYYKLTVDEVNKAIKQTYNPDKLIFVDCGKTVKSGQESGKIIEKSNGMEGMHNENSN
jgi:zinc protease